MNWFFVKQYFVSACMVVVVVSLAMNKFVNGELSTLQVILFWMIPAHFILFPFSILFVESVVSEETRANLFDLCTAWIDHSSGVTLMKILLWLLVKILIFNTSFILGPLGISLFVKQRGQK